MRKLIHLYFDPAESESVGGAILESLNAAEAPAPADKPAEGEAPKTKFAWGDEDRRKSRTPLTDEDDLELGYEDEVEGKKVPAKAKYAEVKRVAKLFKENGDTFRAALGMREEFNKNPELAKAFQSFWGKAFEGNKYNPEFVSKMSGFLDGKAQEVKADIQDQTDDIKEMETLLSELDDTSPQAKILRQNIADLRLTRTQLKEALDTIKTMQEKTDGLDKFRTGFEKKQQTDQEEAAAKQASSIFDTELGALTSKDGSTKYQFEDPEDNQDFENLVRDQVASLASQEGRITNDEQFKAAIREAAKTSFEKISRRIERNVNGYLKKKGKSPDKPEEKPNDKKDPDEGKSIGQLVADGMFGAG